MRTALPQSKANGHAVPPGQVFAITGMCQNPSFRLGFRSDHPDDYCLIYLGAAQFGAPVAPAPAGETGGDPYFILRRRFDLGQAIAVLRVEWEGVFTLLANDDECAEALFSDILEPGAPEEVQRGWSNETETVALFTDLLRVQ